MEKLCNKIFCIIILLILLCLFDNFNYQVVSDILSFTIIFILTETMIKNIYYSLFVSFIIFLLLRSSITKYNHQYENFENEDIDNTEKSKESSKDVDDDDTKNKVDIANNLNNVQGNLNSNLENIIKTLSGDSNPIKLSDNDSNEKNELNNDYESILKGAIKAEDNPSSIKNKNASELSPFQAQKETFELINTVQQLSETVKTLGPVLQQGKQVLDLYKHFKF